VIFCISLGLRKEVGWMKTNLGESVMERFDQTVQEIFPEGVVDIKFSVNGNGTTEDAMNQVIEALKQYQLGETRPYMDY
jgi:hypothetical protein